jgi:hypothetical protein
MNGLIDFSIKELEEIIKWQQDMQFNLELEDGKLYNSWLVEWKCNKQIERIKNIPDINHDEINTANNDCAHDYNPLHHSGFIVCEKCEKVYVNE